MSSPHFTLSHWLRVLGLKESDVTIKNIDRRRASRRSTAASATASACGHRHVLRYRQGLEGRRNPQYLRRGPATVLMGDKKFCDANPELVAKFLRVFLRSANMLQKEAPESLAPEYCRFFQEFVGKSFTPEMAGARHQDSTPFQS